MIENIFAMLAVFFVGICSVVAVLCLAGSRILDKYFDERSE